MYTVHMKAKNERRMKADWEKIRIEYISGIETMRGLSRKYGLSVSTISARAKRDGWKQDAKGLSDKITEKCEQVMVDRALSNQEKALTIIDELLDKMAQAVRYVDKKDVPAMKNLVQSMKDLKDLGVFETDRKDNEIVIRIEGGDDYAD